MSAEKKAVIELHKKLRRYGAEIAVVPVAGGWDARCRACFGWERIATRGDWKCQCCGAINVGPMRGEPCRP